MDANSRYTVGFDFGTESVRVVIADVADGRIVGVAVEKYAHGVIDRSLPGSSAVLPADYALQHPQDWLDAAAAASTRAVGEARVPAEALVGVGVAFTSCTMLPARADGTPLCLTSPFASVPLAWPKLWKHHAAKDETDRINVVARQREESWLGRYGGVIGVEWFFPKVLETLNQAPAVYEATDVWIEAGDWIVWQLVGGTFPRSDAGAIVRSTCQAGYKAMWNAGTGYPSAEYFAAVHPKLADVATRRMPGTLAAPGQAAGRLSESAATLLGLPAGLPVSAAVIDAHAGVPGAGVAEPGTLVMVIGTSACHMLMSRTERLVPGVAGVVADGILPGSFGYETGQSSVGDAFAWLVETFGLSHDALSRAAADLPPGAGGVMATDWFNGCRTPLMDGRLSGSFIGLTLGTRPEQLYRALIEATAFGLKWIVDTLRDGDVPVERIVASGGLPAKSPLLMQIYADVLGSTIRLAENDQSVAVGAAILGALAAGPKATGHGSAGDAVRAMARVRSDLAYEPDERRHQTYIHLYRLYRSIAKDDLLAHLMHELRTV